MKPLLDSDVQNPEASAGSIVNAAASGDTSGLRALVSQARANEQKARALTPPASCVHYHRRLLHVLAQSREMLEQLESAISGGNVDTLPALLSQANETKSQADALTREERSIKARFGVER